MSFLPPPARFLRRPLAVAAGGALVLFAGTAPAWAHGGGAPAYRPGEVVVGYKRGADERTQARVARAVGARPGPRSGVRARVLRVPRGQVRATVARLRRDPSVAYAAPNPIARASGLVRRDAAAAADRVRHTSAQTAAAPPRDATPQVTRVPGAEDAPTAPLALPNDVGRRGYPGGLAALQWNFFDPHVGVGALQAWANVRAAGAEGGRGVRVAVLDTGVAYRNYGRYRRSPDFAGTRFAAPYDFVTRRRLALDRNGHGTHVAGTIAEATNNRIGVTGLAYGATIIPVRVLDPQGYGDAATIARGIRYAARRGAKIINMSLEFSTSVRAREIPDILAAIRFAHRRGAIVVGSTGNEGAARVAYPARAGLVLSVGAITDAGCLSDFSNDGFGLDLVAPGGGNNANLPNDPNCAVGHRGRDIFQMTYRPRSVSRFGLPPGYDGTSMAAPHVAATAALVVASGVLGANPTPAQVECRLKATARTLGMPGPNRVYGWGLVDAAAATTPTIATPACASRSAKANPPR